MRPDDIAVVLGQARLSYGELEERANRLAHHLISRHAGAERIVAILLDRSIEMVVAVLAILKAGGAYMPLDPDHPDARIAATVAESQCGLIVSTAAHAARLPAGAACVLLDRDAAAIARCEPTPPEAGVGPDNLAYVLFTSGSTGTPKGSMIPHRGLANLVRAQQHLYGVAPGSRVLQFARFAFDAATWDIATTLCAGAALYLLPADALDDSEALGAAMRAHRITAAMLPPAVLPLLDPSALGDLQRLIVGGDVLSPSLAAPWCDRVELINAYGPTEASVCATYSNVLAGSVPAIGRPIPGVEVHVLDDNLDPVGAHEAGELFIAGEGLARGYCRRPGLTAERFLPNPFGAPGSRLYRSGDMVRRRPDGELEFLGRADRQVKIRGFRIELGEVESALSHCDGVAQAAVTLAADGPARKSLMAHVEAATGQAPDRDALVAQLRQRLPAYMVPAHFAFYDRLPLTANGKIDRRALLDAPVQAPADAIAAPRTDIEQCLADAWAWGLKTERIGTEDDFFELGGDSIVALRIVSRLRQQGIWLSVRNLYDHPTIAALARIAVAARDWVEEDAAGAPLMMTPIQRWFFDLGLANPHRFNQSCLLACREPLDAGMLQRALDATLAHHAAFATRFARRADGWSAFVSEGASENPIECFDLADTPDAQLPAALSRILDDQHRRLDIGAGPLCRGALINLGGGRGQRLYLVAHHLAVDLVSWRILVEDLQRAHVAIRSGLPLRLPAKTQSYRSWAARLAAYPDSPEGRRELAFWRGRAWPDGEEFPVDHPGGTNFEGSAEAIEFEIDPGQTSAILRGAMGARVNDILLAGLARGYAAWSGKERLIVDLEGHGREEFLEGTDVTRTVGWFTSIFPVPLEARRAGDLRALLGGVSQTLSAIPHRGAGYGALRYSGAMGPPVARAPVSFNYWGRLDDDISAGQLFDFLGQDEGERRDPGNLRTHLVEINCHVVSDRLRFQLLFSRELHRPGTIAALADHFHRAVAELAELCRSHQPWEHLDLSLIDMELEL